MGYLTIGGHVIRADDDTFDVPCVGGEGTAFTRGSVLVEITPDGPALARTGEPLVARGTEQLVGWGDLDGPATDYGTAGVSLLIPTGMIEQLTTHARA